MISPYKLWEMSKGNKEEYRRLLLKHGCIILKKGNKMHYKNGREAKNGDKVILIPTYGNPTLGILYDATVGNDSCNGRIAPISAIDPMPNLAECLHIEDVLKVLPTQVPDSSKM